MAPTKNNTAARQRISYRVDPCKCGCSGRDSWHAQDFTRTVRGIRFVDGGPRLERVQAGFNVMIVAEGWAKMPWSKAQRVVFAASINARAGSWLPGGWYVAYGLDYEGQDNPPRVGGADALAWFCERRGVDATSYGLQHA